jgi:hypothetical protein
VLGSEGAKALGGNLGVEVNFRRATLVRHFDVLIARAAYEA